MSRRAEDITPQQREERIAELRARRRARLRTLAIRSGIGISALVLLGVLAVYWVLQTVAGRDVLLAQVVARLPAGSSLTWSKVEGPLAGPLILHDLDFRYDGLHFSAEEALLDPDIRPLLGRKLRLDALRIRNAVLELGPSEDTPFELPSWPDVLPALELPLAVQADSIVVDGLRIVQQDAPPIAIRRIRGGLEAADGEFRAKQIKLNGNLGDFRIDGHYLPRQDYATDLTVRALMPASSGQPAARLGLVARGDLTHMEVALAGYAPEPLHASVVIDGRDNPTWSVALRSERLDPAPAVPGPAPGIAPAPAGQDRAARCAGPRSRSDYRGRR